MRTIYLGLILGSMAELGTCLPIQSKVRSEGNPEPSRVEKPQAVAVEPVGAGPAQRRPGDLVGKVTASELMTSCHPLQLPDNWRLASTFENRLNHSCPRSYKYVNLDRVQGFYSCNRQALPRSWRFISLHRNPHNLDCPTSYRYIDLDKTNFFYSCRVLSVPPAWRMIARSDNWLNSDCQTTYSYQRVQ